MEDISLVPYLNYYKEHISVSVSLQIVSNICYLLIDTGIYMLPGQQHPDRESRAPHGAGPQHNLHTIRIDQILTREHSDLSILTILIATKVKMLILLTYRGRSRSGPDTAG